MKGGEGAKEGVDDKLRRRFRGDGSNESGEVAKGEPGVTSTDLVGAGAGDSGNEKNEGSASELGPERFAKGSSSSRSASGVSRSFDGRDLVERVDAALVSERAMTEGVLDSVRCLTGI